MKPASKELIAIGKNSVNPAAKIQWVKLPKDWPFARTEFGKISEMNTQIIVPDPIACEAMKVIIHTSTILLTEPKLFVAWALISKATVFTFSISLPTKDSLSTM